MSETKTDPKPAPQTKAQAAAPPAPWKVLDTTCPSSPPPNAVPGSGPLPRTHEIMIEGQIRAYTFKYGQALEMPEAEARKFVPIESFIVTNPKGNRVRAAIPILKGFDGQGLTLEENQCVARFDELSLEALIERAMPLPGGEKVERNRHALAAFIVESRNKRIKQNLSPERGMGELDEMSPEELKRISELEAA